MRRLMETPVRAISGGRIEYGLYKTPFQELNLLDADIFDRGGSSPRWLRRLRLKEWEHFGIFTRDFFLGVAVVDLKLAGLSWCCVFDRETRTLCELQRKLLPGKIRIPPELRDGAVELRSGRGYRVSIENRLRQGNHRLVLSMEARGGFPGVSADLTLWERPEEVQPLIALLPLGENRPFFSHKAPSRAEGEVRIGKRSYSLKGRDAVALLDFHRAFYPRKTFWEWATFAGYDQAGDLIGMNVTRNLIARDDLYNENGIWFRNTLHPVGAADFRIPPGKGELWHIRTRDGNVDLVFKPLGGRSESIRLGPFLSHYVQPVGLFSGKLIDGAGIVHTVEDMFGVTEDHRVTW